MSAKKNYWPVLFVAGLLLALILSNRTPQMPGGGEAIQNDLDYQAAKAKMEALSLERIKAMDEGKPLSADDLKKLREAGEIVDRMNKFAPLVSGLYYLSGKIHFALKEDALAEAAFRQCTLIAPNQATADPGAASHIRETAAEAAYQLSLLLLVRRDVPGAYDAANQAVSAFPQSPNYLTARASALNELRRVDEAKKDLAMALELDPKNARAQSLLEFIRRDEAPAPPKKQ